MPVLKSWCQKVKVGDIDDITPPLYHLLNSQRVPFPYRVIRLDPGVGVFGFAEHFIRTSAVARARGIEVVLPPSVRPHPFQEFKALHRVIIPPRYHPVGEINDRFRVGYLRLEDRNATDNRALRVKAVLARTPCILHEL